MGSNYFLSCKKPLPASSRFYVNDVTELREAKDKTAFRAKHAAELIIFEVTKSTLLAVQGDGTFQCLNVLRAEQERPRRAAEYP